MKFWIIVGLLITASLSLVTNLVSNFLSEKAQKNQKFWWILFILLIIASVIVAIIPQQWYSSQVEILDSSVSDLQNEDEKLYSTLKQVYCTQQVKLVNRGNYNSTLVKYVATLKYGKFEGLAKSFSSQPVEFLPSLVNARLSHFEISALPFAGDSVLAPLPSVITAQNTLDFVTEIHFAYDPTIFNVYPVHSHILPTDIIPVLIQYQFELADRSVIKTEDIPCAFIEHIDYSQ